MFDISSAGRPTFHFCGRVGRAARRRELLADDGAGGGARHRRRATGPSRSPPGLSIRGMALRRVFALEFRRAGFSLSIGWQPSGEAARAAGDFVFVLRPGRRRRRPSSRWASLRAAGLPRVARWPSRSRPDDCAGGGARRRATTTNPIAARAPNSRQGPRRCSRSTSGARYPLSITIARARARVDRYSCLISAALADRHFIFAVA